LNVDLQELKKFETLAHRWWDPESEFKPLHEINPLRLDYIDRKISGFGEKRVLDVGCGGGILAESMAQRGAEVIGIDLAEKPLKVAMLHLLETGARVDYRQVAAETLALEAPHAFDVVTCMEMLEHVPDPSATVRACSTLVKPGGHVFFSTINRNFKAYLLAVIGAEYVLKLLPRGTHDYAKFVTPAELSRFCREAALQVQEIIGMTYNPFSKIYALGTDTDVNYIVASRATAERP
jgi:2-polyprenyl-6-hydroxyphenyl methylase / 3-demethylubiquinone-9 3-methyltransferase